MSSGPHSSEHDEDLLKGWGEVSSVAVSPHVVKSSPVRLNRMHRRSPKCASPPQGMPLNRSGTQPGCIWLVCSMGPAGRLEAESGEVKASSRSWGRQKACFQDA